MADPRAPVVILLDSCSYFRLGLPFHPILVRLLGDPEYVLMVIEELDRECARSSRLRTKFWWANSEEHRNERKSNCYSLRGKKAKDAALVFSYIDQYAKDNNIGVSLIDKRVLSATYTANGYVVTDDVDMQSVAAAFGIKVFSTLQLLQLLYERGRVKVEEIDSVIEYWNYENDLPTGFAAIHAWRNSIEQ